MARINSMLKVIGANKLINQLDRKKKNYAEGVEKGLVMGGLFLQRESQKIVPVDTGHLKNTAGTRKEGSGWKTVVFVFYTAFYAIYVHENMAARHKPGKTAKFLSGPAHEKRREIRAVINSVIDKYKGKK